MQDTIQTFFSVMHVLKHAKWRFSKSIKPNFNDTNGYICNLYGLITALAFKKLLSNKYGSPEVKNNILYNKLIKI